MAHAGRVVLVTGAGGGIGSAIAHGLLDAGHCVAAHDRNAAALETLAASASEDRLVRICGELADPRACAEAVERTVARFGRIDGLINNAGIGPSSIRPDAEVTLLPIEELDAEIWDRFFAVNVRAPMLLTRSALPYMKAAKWGRIVNNTTSYMTMLRILPYGATKSALESMSAIWAAELASSGITVNVLIPGGPTDTPFVAAATGWARDKMIRPAVMGPPAVFLMSDAAGAVTGQRITAARWNPGLTSAAAMAAASRPIGWPELTADVVWMKG